MSYKEMSDAYASDRQRYRACIHEQAQVFAAPTRTVGGEQVPNTPQDQALGRSIIAGSPGDEDAIIWAISTGPNWAALGDDGPLLSAVQSAWPTVAGALHPQA